jgi:inosose dehydratase
MNSQISRRDFIAGLGTTALASLFPWQSFAGTLTQAAAPFQFGYAAITWGGNDVQAIKDIASLGFKGIQLRANVIAEYGDKPQELKNLLTQHKLSVPVFSSGNINVNPQERQAHLDKHLAHARFVKALDGKYLQLTNNARPKDRQPTTDELRNLGKLMGEIGKRTADLDITVVYHNHMHQLGETPEEVDIIMEAADPAAVKLLLDIAHYHQGGGDPAKAMRTYGDRVAVMHLKDVESPVPDEPGKAYRFVELGRGRVDLPAVFAAMKEKNFRGWAVIELDSVPDKSRTPLESARISKEYLNQKMNFRI